MPATPNIKKKPPSGINILSCSQPWASIYWWKVFSRKRKTEPKNSKNKEFLKILFLNGIFFNVVNQLLNADEWFLKWL